MLSGDNFSSLATDEKLQPAERVLTSSTMFSRVTGRRGLPEFLSIIRLNTIGGSATSIFITKS